MQIITNEVIDDRIKDRNFIRVGNCINSYTKIKWKCLIDGYEWETTPDKILNTGTGCPKCSNCAKLSNEMIDERIKDRKIIRVGNCMGANTKIKWKCLVDGYEWETSPSSIMHCYGKGQGCPKCSKCAKLSNEIIDNRLSKVNNNIERIGEYVNSNVKVSWRCKIDKCEWSALPLNILKGHGCPKCGGNLRLTNEVIDIRLKDSNRDIERVGNYINKTTKIKWKCLKDGHIWETEPRNVLQRKNGCPICKASRSEQQIKSFLINNNIEYVHNHKFVDCRYKNELPFDFYIPSHNLCIEYDGEQHYKSIKHFGGQKKFISRKKIDAIKTKFCHDTNIKLLRIPYWDANKIPQILAENILTSGTIE